MQIILGILLTIIGILYCLEVIMPIHERFLQRIKKRCWKAYLSFQSKVFFGAALMLILTDIAKQVDVITSSQNRVAAAGVCAVGIGLALYNYRRCKEKISNIEVDEIAASKTSQQKKFKVHRNYS